MSTFADLRRQLRDLQDPRTLHELHNIAGAAVHELILDGFAHETDPYGVPWQATRRPNRILQDTLALRNGIRWKADSRAVVVSTSGRANAYAAFHQRGTRRLPERKFMPDESQPIPPAYEARLRNEFETYFRQRYGGR